MQHIVSAATADEAWKSRQSTFGNKQRLKLHNITTLVLLEETHPPLQQRLYCPTIVTVRVSGNQYSRASLTLTLVFPVKIVRNNQFVGGKKA